MVKRGKKFVELFSEKFELFISYFDINKHCLKQYFP